MVIWLTRPSRCERSTLAERKTLADQGSQRQALPTRASVKRPALARSTSSSRSPRWMPAAPRPGRIGASRSSMGASHVPLPWQGRRLGAGSAGGGARRRLGGTRGAVALLELAGALETLVPGDTLGL